MTLTNMQENHNVKRIFKSVERPSLLNGSTSSNSENKSPNFGQNEEQIT